MIFFGVIFQPYQSLVINNTLDIFADLPVLENERVILRKIEREDIPALLPFSLHEPDLWKFGAVTGAGKENLEKYVDSALDAFEMKNEYPFIIFDKKEKKFAGSTRFYDIQQAWQSTQLGYTWYGKEFQRTGLNRHCKLLLFTYAFEKWGMLRVELRADIKNLPSVNAMKAIGCVEEGVLRNHMPRITGGRRDSIILSILKEEWDNHVKEKLLNKIRP